ncbi:DUF3110 domain-containing protein [Kovacikia minuta CCNUW1]|uniref:DUF3110 domain-containing protein n=1 Tax=Kovacikia minuta TaxID=2931930 RepID=UPI001CCE54ED|nr:DUF3110 domain-containing protein [Kovacikia minuta]UBF26034.1 DUF3110 domain-containing protein [Kovacikia minuta CCNUW1]
MQVFVLLFNARTENEGIHTIRVGDRNLVLMFEDEDDATRYALLLEAQDFPTSTIEALDQQEIEEFCESAGYHSQLVPKGFVPQSDAERLLMVPPETNVDKPDWSVESELEDKDLGLEDEEPMADADLERIRRQLEGLL